MTPVVDRLACTVVIALNDPLVLAEQLPFSRHNQPTGIDTQANGPVGVWSRDTLAVALKVNQAGG